MTLARNLLVGFLFLQSASLFGQLNPLYEESPVHEAFSSPIEDITPIRAILTKPPAPKAETAPPQTNFETVWIPGYWAWVPQRDDFTWVCGVWRKPPPNHVWISGDWIEHNNGWAWMRGFWSPVEQSLLRFIPIPPPNMLDETQGTPPDSDHFWVHGYWEYNISTGKHRYLKGSWHLYDFLWILIPAHYEWRPVGYIFIPMYWDWPVEKRGTAYECTMPLVILEPSLILRRLFYCYPNYLSIYDYYWHFHKDWWTNCWCLPPWWEWKDWWWFTWHDHWSLWWWWSHPGFPPPFWLKKAMSKKILPPKAELLDFFKNVPAPLFIIPEGIPTSAAWLDAIKSELKTPGKSPVLPTKPHFLERILEDVKNSLPKSNDLRPTGKGIIPPQPRPTSMPHVSSITPGGKVTIPPIPEMPTQVIIPRKPPTYSSSKRSYPATEGDWERPPSAQDDSQKPQPTPPDQQQPPATSPNQPVTPPSLSPSSRTIRPPTSRPVVPHQRSSNSSGRQWQQANTSQAHTSKRNSQKSKGYQWPSTKTL